MDVRVQSLQGHGQLPSLGVWFPHMDVSMAGIKSASFLGMGPVQLQGCCCLEGWGPS